MKQTNREFFGGKKVKIIREKLEEFLDDSGGVLLMISPNRPPQVATWYSDNKATKEKVLKLVEELLESAEKKKLLFPLK